MARGAGRRAADGSSSTIRGTVHRYIGASRPRANRANRIERIDRTRPLVGHLSRILSVAAPNAGPIRDTSVG